MHMIRFEIVATELIDAEVLQNFFSRKGYSATIEKRVAMHGGGQQGNTAKRDENVVRVDIHCLDTESCESSELEEKKKEVISNFESMFVYIAEKANLGVSGEYLYWVIESGAVFIHH